MNDVLGLREMILRSCLEVLVSEGAVLFALRLFDHTNDPALRKESVEGWVRLSVPISKFQKECGKGSTQTRKYLRELEDVGLVKRNQKGGQTYDTFVRVKEAFVREVKDRVHHEVLGRFGIDLAKVAYQYDDFQRWEGASIEMGQDVFSRSRSLAAEIAKSQQGTEEARKRNEERRKNRPKPKKNSMPKEHQAPVMLKHFHFRVRTNLGLVPESDSSKKLWGQMKRLRDQYGADSALEIIEFVTTHSGWNKARSEIWQLKDSIVPTVGKLLSHAAEILNLSRETSLPKRSGGARATVGDDEEVSF